jgi:TP901 family phage tail tape measure protein
MANVAGTSAETASQQLTAIWNNFYDGSESLEHYADVLVKLGAATASSSDEISEGIEKFAAVANTVGLSYEYAASALATVTAQTRESASVVGTAFRTLFSRIQGLQQGETLDDGTTLNKYSQALANVGVQIKDASGELKGMDEILDDLGGKWDTLAQDQKIALAETVAGVRQWTQLIALMDNWDFFKENLALAENADGALTQQADIYAESWEAARDRTKAATEDIYDSLINPNFYIGVDNVITPLLSRTADVIDALGGLNGILAVVALGMNKIYGDKIAQSMRNMAVNLDIITGKEGERARAL